MPMTEPETVTAVYLVRLAENDWRCYSCGEMIAIGDDFVLGPREGIAGLNYFHADCWEDYDANA